ncbi:hypothetical protein J3B02_004650 [Coemansia erecta]|uniref:NmrA-like domain-containing protein n=1 Tax=Coemansia asiatica TaxID=1052880 RepID=A0A9W7XLK1_9FUNG|nr:hypothetical protein LPJ64_003052 [Coemansia asiatica]KAJ2845552.1 hypothetical protein J3B02_004650 [Coemansia erecta]KAJ2876318.1 hypothetical protein FB639_003914 [Coemansia asiatica]
MSTTTSSSPKIVAVVGATGNQGGSVVKSLYQTGKYKIRALTRSAQSDAAIALKAKYSEIELVEVTSDHVDSLRKAFKGADIVFGVTRNYHDYDSASATNDTNGEIEHGKAIVDAAIAENVRTLVYSGIDSIKQLSNGKYTGALNCENKYEISQYLVSKSDQIQGLLVYCGYYMENYVHMSRLSPEDNNTVEFISPFDPTELVPLVDTTNDMGAVVAHILETPEKYQGKPVEVSSGFYEIQEMVKAFTQVTGKPARYVKVPFDFTGVDYLTQMFKGFSEFGYFSERTEFVEHHRKAGIKFTTPVEFWKARNWNGPTQ